MSRAKALLLLLLSGGLVTGAACKKRAAQEAKHTWASTTLSLSKIFEIQDSAQFSSELGFYLVLKSHDQGFSALTQSEQLVAALWELEAEVNNGGFSQYFLNSAGDHWAEALSGLDTIGANQTAILLRSAISVFPSGKPSPVREVRFKQLDALPESARKLWSDLDSKFYEYPDSMHELILEYGRKHRGEFK